MIKIRILGCLAYSAAATLLWAGSAHALNCAAYTNTLTNGTTADASQVMQNFSDIRNCANNNLAPVASPSFTGNVGIGTTSPTAPLHVSGSNSGGSIQATVQNTSSSGDGRIRALSDAGVVDIIANGSGTGWWGSQAPGAGIIWSNSSYLTLQNTGTSGIIQFNTGSTPAERMRVTSAGNVGIGTTTPSLTLYVNGTAGGTSGWQSPSDSRLKKNVEPIADGLSLVQKLRPVRFEWRAPSEREIGKTLVLPLGERSIGFVAQDVEAVVPEATVVPKKGSDNPYSLKEAYLVPILVAAVQEQQAEIDELRSVVSLLRDQLPATK